ncbi:HEAT repeat domain-containing protein [Methanimicrococcus sp. OttesenSCG-928-J09]|nr:HEAT repeat domain-containing protein [Methanimicrococcus sp. OttesenSCG-928-J09]
MTNSESNKEILQNRLHTIQSLQNPTADDLSLLIQILLDSSENPVIQAAAIPVFQKSGKISASLLFSEFQKLSDSDSDIKIKISYALSQISETPNSVYPILLSDKTARVRQNAVLGLAGKNDPAFYELLYDVLLNDSDPETAFEAAAALSLGKAETLPYFESVITADIKQNPYIDSETNLISSNKVPPKSADPHVLAKVIEILGDIGNEKTLPYLTPYCAHPDERVAAIAAKSIQKIEADSK